MDSLAKKFKSAERDFKSKYIDNEQEYPPTVLCVEEILDWRTDFKNDHVWIESTLSDYFSINFPYKPLCVYLDNLTQEDLDWIFLNKDKILSSVGHLKPFIFSSSTEFNILIRKDQGRILMDTFFLVKPSRENTITERLNEGLGRAIDLLSKHKTKTSKIKWELKIKEHPFIGLGLRIELHSETSLKKTDTKNKILKQEING